MPNFVKAASTAGLLPGTAIRIEIEGHEIALYNLNGEFFATSDICTHRRASLSAGAIEGDAVVCPWHAARYEIRTGKYLGAGPRPFPDLRIYAVQVVGDDVAIDVDAGDATLPA